jgi:hypothetical protein
MFVSCECFVLSCRGLCVGQITRPECGVFECDREVSILKRSWPTNGRCTIGKKKDLFTVYIPLLFCTYS